MSENEPRDTKPQIDSLIGVFRRQMYTLTILLSLMLIGRPDIEGRKVLYLIDLKGFISSYLLLGLLACIFLDYAAISLDYAAVQSSSEVDRSYLRVIGAVFLIPGLYIFGQLLEAYLGLSY